MGYYLAFLYQGHGVKIVDVDDIGITQLPKQNEV